MVRRAWIWHVASQVMICYSEYASRGGDDDDDDGSRRARQEENEAKEKAQRTRFIQKEFKKRKGVGTQSIKSLYTCTNPTCWQCIRKYIAEFCVQIKVYHCYSSQYMFILLCFCASLFLRKYFCTNIFSPGCTDVIIFRYYFTG